MDVWIMKSRAIRIVAYRIRNLQNTVLMHRVHLTIIWPSLSICTENDLLVHICNDPTDSLSGRFDALKWCDQWLIGIRYLPKNIRKRFLVHLSISFIRPLLRRILMMFLLEVAYKSPVLNDCTWEWTQFNRAEILLEDEQIPNQFSMGRFLSYSCDMIDTMNSLSVAITLH